MSLCLHAGAASIDRAGLAALPLAQPRGARHVIRPFVEDVELVDHFLAGEGYLIADEAFGVKTGTDGLPSQFFGALEIRPRVLTGEYIPAAGDKEFALTVGIRGSYDQSLPRGLAVGSRVFVCDNLAFSGEVTVTTKQTLNIADRLPALLRDAVARIPAVAAQQNVRFDAYRNASLKPRAGDAILVECVRRGILNPSNIGQAIKEWDEPRHAEHAAQGYSVWRLFNAVTEAIKPANPERAHILPAWDRTTKLTQYLDQGIGLIH
jgi:hypothetical protein